MKYALEFEKYRTFKYVLVGKKHRGKLYYFNHEDVCAYFYKFIKI